MAMKENDWILDSLANPDKQLNDFLIAGYNTSNTQLLPKELYKNNQVIQNAFTENGSFNDVKFDQFYKDKASSYGRMQQLGAIDTFQYNPFDVEASKNAFYKSPEFNLIRISNPLRDKTTLTGAIYESGLSQREIAQKNKIYDPVTGTFSNDTLNDRALSSSPLKFISDIFADPIIYATYDSDGEHIDQITGEKVKHTKGEYKLNAFGEPYTEKLNGRSLIGKEVVSIFDNLTVDGEGLNKYDFLDSDGIDKSTAGTIIKGAATLAPMIIPYVGEVYAGLMVAKELSKTLPMLYGIVAPWVGLPDEQPVLNTIAGYGKKFSQSTSDESNQSVFNKEQLVNLISDVALQWGQQMFVSKAIQKLKGTSNMMEDATSKAFVNYTLSRQGAEQALKSGQITQKYFDRLFGDVSKWSESIFGKSSLEAATKGIEDIIQKSNRLGADASLIYMALVSNTDVYDTMKQAGATAKEASAVTLGATLGMFGVDKYLHLGEVFFDDLTTPTIKQIQRTQRNAAKSFIDNGILDEKIINGAAEKNIPKIKRLLKAGMDIGRKGIFNYMDSLKYHTTGMFGKALGEGIEETAEELVTDMTKGLYELAGSLGMDTGAKDVGAWDNILERYGMSFLGGFLGGGIYYGKDVIQNGKFQIDTTQDDYIYLVRNGKTQQALDALDEAHKKGKLASTDLSMETTTDADGNKIYLTADDNRQSQNDYVYNRIKDVILQLDGIIGSVDGKKTDDDLLDQILLKESRFRDLKDYLKIKDFSYLTGYQQEYQKLLNNIADLQGMYDRASQTKTGLAYSSNADFEANKMTDLEKRNLSEDQVKEREKNLNKILDNLNAAKKELQKYNSGEYSLDYIDRILFAMDEQVNSDFVQLNYETWLYKNHNGKTPEELTDDEKAKYKKEYLDYKQSQQKEDLANAYNLYKNIGTLINPALKELSKNQVLFQQQRNMLDEISKLQYRQYGWDQVLDFNGETKESEEYINRNNDETRNKRAESILKENDRITKEFFEKLNNIIEKYGDYIDPVTKRNLKLSLINRKRDFVNQHIEKLKQSLYNTEYDENNNIVQENVLSDIDEYFLKLVQNWNDDNHNDEKLIQNFRQFLIEKFRTKYARYQDILKSMNLWDKFINPILVKDDLLAIIGDKELANEFFSMFENLDDEQSENLKNYLLYHSSIELVNKDLLSEKSEINQLFNIYNNRFNDYKKAISDDYNIKTFDLLEQKVKDTGIVNQLIKKISSKLNFKLNVESLLDHLDKELDSMESRDDFVIINNAIEDLQEMQKILKLAQSYVFASAKIPNMLSPEGHNSVLNEIAEKHKDIFKDFDELPTLDQDTANSILSTLEQYIQQIGVEDPSTGTYNQNSYLYLSSINSVNKALIHKKTDKALNASLVKLLQHRESFKFKFNGKIYDLMDGAETITENPEQPYITFNKYATILYNNIQKLLKDGWTYKDIIERSQILEKISAFNKNPEDFIQQNTSSIDSKLTYDRLTSYDKVVNLLTIMSIDPKKYNIYLQERIQNENNKVPLTAQEWISRVGIAMVNNVELFNSAIDYISSKINIDKSIFRNTIFINANQGAGKTSVCAKNIAMWDQKSTIWISAPKENQVQSLFNNIGNGIRMTNRTSITIDSKESESLISRIIKNKKNYDLAMDYIYGKTKNIPDFISQLENDQSIYFKIDYLKLGIEKDSNAPTIIIIDEATHLSLFELDCIQHYCNINNTRLILLGDNKQNGFTDVGKNLRTSAVFMWRTQNLNISLRDNNIQHNENLLFIESLLDQSLITDSNDTITVEKIIAYRKALNFKYCLKDGLNGDVVTNKLNNDLISELKGKIGYIGKESDKEYKQLTDAGLDVIAMEPLDVQGQEFDYIVVNKKYEVLKNQDLFDNFLLLQDIYTMMSRGRNGSIFIDPSNSLKTMIGENKVETVTFRSGNILDYAKQFQDEKLNMLKKINGDEKQEPKEAEKKSTINPEEKNTWQSAQEKNGDIPNEPQKEEIKIPYERDMTDPIQIVKYTDFINSPGITFDNDFNNKYYVLYSIVEGITEDQPADGTTRITNVKKASKLNTLQSAIGELTPGQSLIIMVVPKIEGMKNNITGQQILNRMKEDGVDIENIQNKYIYKIIQNDSAKQNIDNAIPIPVEKPKELKLEDSVQDNFDISDIESPGNMLAYGKVSFTGLIRKYDDNGLEVWQNNHVNGQPKRDMELFTNDGETIDANDQRQTELSKLVKSFKNGILYKTKYKNLPEQVKNIISEDEYNKINYRITIRKKTAKDNFIRNIGISEKDSTIGDYLYVVEGVFKIKDNQQGILTIGLMSNPKTWIDNATSNIDKYKNKIDELAKKKDNALKDEDKKIIQDQIDHYNQLIKDNDTSENADSAINKYLQFINKLTSLLESSGKDSLSIDVDLHTSSMTDIHKTNHWHRITRITQATIDSIKSYISQLESELQKEGISLYRKSQLQAMIDKATEKFKKIQEIKENSFASLNPYTIIGDQMVVYTGNSLDISDHIRGRYVAMLVTNDPTLPKDKLLDEYLKQKNDQKENIGNTKPRVRLIPLNPVGVSFQDLSSTYMKEALSSIVTTKNGTTKQPFPFKTHYMGVRMYTAMWNFRANLNQFLNAVKQFTDDLKNNKLIEKDTDLDKYLLVNDIEYLIQNGKITPEEQEYYNRNKNLEHRAEITKAINEFNERLTTDLQIKRFRLGGGIRNGAYIRKIDGAQKLYNVDGTKTIFGIYGTINIFNNYKNAIDSIFTNILDQIIKCDYDPNKVLSNNNGVINSFSNHITSLLTNNGYTECEGEKVEFVNNTGIDIPNIGNVFSHIPMVLSKSYKYITKYITQTQEEELSQNPHEKINIKASGSTDETEINWQRVLNDIGGRTLGTQELINDEFGAFDSVLNSKRFEDLFSLMFHGTIDDFHDDNTIKDSLAQFPNGFYADPLTAGNQVISPNGDTVFKIVAYQPYFWETDVSIGDPTFFVSEKRTSNTIAKNKQEPHVETNTFDNYKTAEHVLNSDKYNKIIPQKAKVEITKKLKEDFLDENKDNELTEAEIEEQIKILLDDYADNYNNFTNLLLNKGFNFDQFIMVGGQVQTFNDFLNNLLNIENDNSIQEINYDEQSGIITITDSKKSEYKIQKDINGNWIKLGNKQIDLSNENSIDQIIKNAEDFIGENADEDFKDEFIENTSDLKNLFYKLQEQGKLDDSDWELINNIKASLEDNDLYEKDNPIGILFDQYNIKAC